MTTFITGNIKKAEYLQKLLGINIDHKKINLTEIQSLSLNEVVAHKAREAYAIVNSPVLVEDVSLEFKCLGRLPGTFIKFFLEEMSESEICDLILGEDRSATAKCTFGYYDGNKLVTFEGSLNGQISKQPKGSNGYGWDRIFIPNGYSITRAEMNKADDELTYLHIKPIEQVRDFLLKRVEA